MKCQEVYFAIVLLLLLAMLVGCKQNGSSPSVELEDGSRVSFTALDSLADFNPDSADNLLSRSPLLRESGAGDGCDKTLLLLRIKTDDKLYRPVTHYRDTILQLVDYFEHHRKELPSFLGKTGPALPYLYAGRIFTDLGDAPQALDYYQRALDVIPGGKIKNGLHKTDHATDRRLAKQRGLLHSFIGALFSYQDLFEEAILHFAEANRWAIWARDTSDIIFNYRDVAEQYKFIDKNDSSLLFYQKALEFAKMAKDTIMCNDVMAQMASLYNKMGNHILARKYILPSLSLIDSASISGICSIASETYARLGCNDSATVYFNKLLIYGSGYGKRYAYKQLSELAFQHGNIKSASDYFQRYKLLDDSIQKRDKAETVARMHAAYNYQKHERETARLKVANAQKEKIIAISGFIIAFLAGIIYVLIYRNNQNKLRNARQQQLLREIQSALENEHIAREKSSNIQEESLAAFKRTNIYKTFLLLSQTQDRNVSKTEWDDFSQEFNNYFPDFRLKLSGMFNLSTKQYRVCMLRKSGFGTTAICHLACYEKISVYSIYKRLYFQATGKKGSTADFDNLLKAL